jgi:hypothetical protein
LKISTKFICPIGVSFVWLILYEKISWEIKCWIKILSSLIGKIWKEKFVFDGSIRLVVLIKQLVESKFKWDHVDWRELFYIICRSLVNYTGWQPLVGLFVWR